MDIISSWVYNLLVLLSVYLCFPLPGMPPLPAIMYNSELTVPANVHLLCRSVCFLQTPDNNDVLYVTEKATQMVGCSACLLAARAPCLVLSLFLVLIRGPPLPVVAVRHLV